MRVPRIQAIRVHRGANLHAPGRCLTVSIDWGDLPREATAAVENWRRAVVDHPALAAAGHGDGLAVALARLDEDRGPARALPRLAAALQRAMHHDVPDPGDAVPTDNHVVVPVRDIEIGVLAARAAFDLLVLARGDPPEAPARAAALLDRYRAEAAVGNHQEDMRRLTARASRRGIPWSRLIPTATIVRLGDGILQVNVDGGSLSSTSKIADTIATRKSIASALMRQHGLPVPANRLVRSADAAVAAAVEIGYPVVLKPAATNAGTAVRVNIRDEAGVRRAYAAAARHGRVLVEQMIAGDHTRLLVFQGRYLSAMRLDPGQVVGDGRRTIAALIDAANAGRTVELTTKLRWIAVDDEAIDLLAQQGWTLDSVPADGQQVRLRNASNASRGGTARNNTRRVHPDNARLAERAAAVVGLDVAGVDLITPDVERSFREVGGMLCEINSGPSLYMREPGWEIEEAVLDGLFPGDRPGRVPIVCVLGEEDPAGLALVAAAVERLAAGPGKVAVVTPSSVRVGDWAFVGAPGRLHDATAAVLGDRETGAAVVLLPVRAVLEEGVAFARCDLALVSAPIAATPTGRLLIRIADAHADPSDPPAARAALDRLAALRVPSRA